MNSKHNESEQCNGLAYYLGALNRMGCITYKYGTSREGCTACEIITSSSDSRLCRRPETISAMFLQVHGDNLQHGNVCGTYKDIHYRACFCNSCSLEACGRLKVWDENYNVWRPTGMSVDLQRLGVFCEKCWLLVDGRNACMQIPCCGKGRRPEGMNTYPSASKRLGEGGIEITDKNLTKT